MESTENKPEEVVQLSRYFSYNGTGADLFKIYIVNVLLTLVTLGLYYPWAKAKILRYHYAEMEFKGSRFSFHGTGNEMFKGFLKALVLFGGIYAGIQVVTYLMQEAIKEGESVGVYMGIVMVLQLCFILLIPLAIVGAAKYRASRSSWRGIYFRYTGTVKGMYKIYGKGLLFTILTFGIYAPFFTVNVINELVSNLRLGNIRFKFTGDGGELFGINFKGSFLTMFTFGIYAFRFHSNTRRFYLNNFRFLQNDVKGTLLCETTGLGYFKLFVPNVFIILFTLGLGTPWAVVRQMKYFSETTFFKGRIDFDNIEQGEFVEEDATVEGVFDMLDFDIA